jgi:hypothetical protein
MFCRDPAVVEVADPRDVVLPQFFPLRPERLAHTDDDEKPETLLDAILTIPPLTEWPPDCREKLRETCKFVISLSRDLKRMTETGDGGGD